MHLSRAKSAWNCFSATLMIVMAFEGQSRMHALQPMHLAESNLILPLKFKGISNLVAGYVTVAGSRIAF
jgi:hypothetical protein